MDVFGTAIVPAKFVTAVRAGCASTGSDGEGLFITGVGPEGGAITHYISSGFVSPAIARFVTSVADTYGIVVSREKPVDAMERNNLTFIEEVQS